MGTSRQHPTIASQSQADRAKWAWEQVSGVSPTDGEYLTEARKLPTRLLSSGLGQTMAYLFAKAKKGEAPDGEGATRLFSQLAHRVRDLHNEPRAKRPVMDFIVALDPQAYRALGREMLETATWIKRFAEGHIESKEESGQRGGTS